MSEDNKDNYSELTLAILKEQCQEQTTLFRQRKDYSTASCYEIWRRVIELGDELACEAILELYQSSVQNWLHRAAVARGIENNYDKEELVYSAFARAIYYITKLGFEKFPTLAGLLGYLQSCCRGEILTEGRAYQKRVKEASPLSPEMEATGSTNLEDSLIDARANVDNEVSETVDGAELHKIVMGRCRTQAERVAIQARYYDEMKPREIAQTFPQFFSSAGEVHKTIERVLYRLSHDNQIKRWANKK